MGIRTERVARLLHREIASLLLTDFSQEVPGFVTITGVRVTKDLSIAYVYLSVMSQSDGDRRAVFSHVESLTPSVRLALAARIRHQVRKIPEIRFFLDDAHEQAARMEALFEDIRVEKEQRESRDSHE
jgi:ribosome-binding factor A